MNRNIKWILTILQIIALTAVVTKFLIYDTIYSPARYRPDSEVTTLIIGDSHAEYALAPEYIKGSQNLATSGEHIFYTYYKLKRLLESRTNVERVILTIFPNTFSKNSDVALFDEEKSPFQIRRYYNLLDSEGREVLKENRRILLLCYLQYRWGLILPDKSEAAAFARLMTRRFEIVHFPSITGYTSNPQNILTDLRMDKILNKYYYEADGTIAGVSEIGIEYLDKIAALCRDRGLELILVATPEYPPYVEAVPQEHKDRFKEIAERTASKQEGVRFYDYTLMELEPKAYLDYDHLNTYGSMLFSKELNRVLEESR